MKIMIDEYLFLSAANIRQKLRFSRLIYKQKKHPKKGAFFVYKSVNEVSVFTLYLQPTKTSIRQSLFT
jgi:hypothetical protein